MAIVNRDLDASEQRTFIGSVFGGNRGGSLLGGASYFIGAPLPFPCTVQSMRSYATGLSGAPLLNLRASRFTAGGLTSILLSISGMVLNAAGTSGVLGYSGLAAAGSTLLQLQAGDCMAVEFAGANTAAIELMVQVTIAKTQDIVQYNGV